MKVALASLAAAVALAASSAALGAGATTSLVSVTPSGDPMDYSGHPSLSADGRYVAYMSFFDGQYGAIYVRDRQTDATALAVTGAKHMVPIQPAISGDGRYVAWADPDRFGDGNVYLHDMTGDTTEVVTLDPHGNPAGGRSQNPSLSEDGRYVAFSSDSTKLTHLNPKAPRNEFVRDMQKGKTQQVNVSSSGKAGDGYCHHPSISADGRYVAFESKAKNLVKGAKGYNIFVRDLKKGKTILASVSSSGKMGDGGSHKPTISGDGRYVAFASTATNLVKDDTNHKTDIFVRDLKKDRTKLVSVSSSGKQSNGDSGYAVISNHGGYITLESDAKNLVSGGTDGETHVFFRDDHKGKTVQADVNSAGHSANRGVGTLIPAYTSSVAMSADGRVVAVESLGTNLDPAYDGDNDAVYVREPLHG